MVVCKKACNRKHAHLLGKSFYLGHLHGLTPTTIIVSHLQLGKLIALYDDNHITIDGDTAVSFTEDVVKRFEAYGWHVQIVSDGDHNLQSIQQAIEKAKSVTDKPSLIKVQTTIGFGSLNQGEEKVHGAPLERKCNHTRSSMCCY